jgi:hypothetical protein
MPDRTPDAISTVLILSHFLTMDVQMAAPMRMNSAAMIDIAVEIKNKIALFATPLYAMFECGAHENRRMDLT